MSVGRRLRIWKKGACIGTGLLLVLLAVPASLAFANAANPCGGSPTLPGCPASGGGGIGSETPAPTTSNPGAVRVTVEGDWTWAGCSMISGLQCSPQEVTAVTSQGCIDNGSVVRVGVGWAMIWNDPDDPGYDVDNSGYSVGSVGQAAGDNLNPQDDTVHVQKDTPCGTTLVPDPNNPGKYFPAGTWGPISHVYESAADVPKEVCVNMYDLHNGQPSDFIAGGQGANGDNSIQTNDFSPSLDSGSCFSPVPAVEKGLLTGDIYLCHSSDTEVPGGTITFTGEKALPNPVSLKVDVGSYGATATAPAGYQFVPCGSTAYTIGSNGTATYSSPVLVTTTTPGKAIFYVQQIPGPTLVLTKTECVCSDVASAGVSGPITVGIGATISYDVTVRNTSAQPAQNVTVTDTMGGSAAFVVNDGTGGTSDSFKSNVTPPPTIVPHGNHSYAWTFSTVAPDSSASVTFSAVLTGAGVAGNTVNSVDVTNTAAVATLPQVTVVANAPLSHPSGVQATSTPSTGGLLSSEAAAAIFMFLGGLAVLLVGFLVKPAGLRRTS